MGDTFKLALQLTMVDMLSGVAQGAKRNILSMGAAGIEAGRNFDLMTHHIAKGLKSIAVVNFGIEKMKPGVTAAADMQESLHKVEMNLSNSTNNAAALLKQLQVIKDTANGIGQNTPFTAQQIAGPRTASAPGGVRGPGGGRHRARQPRR